MTRKWQQTHRGSYFSNLVKELKNAFPSLTTGSCIYAINKLTNDRDVRRILKGNCISSLDFHTHEVDRNWHMGIHVKWINVSGLNLCVTICYE